MVFLHLRVSREDVIDATGWEIRFAVPLETTPKTDAK